MPKAITAHSITESSFTTKEMNIGKSSSITMEKSVPTSEDNISLTVDVLCLLENAAIFKRK